MKRESLGECVEGIDNVPNPKSDPDLHVDFVKSQLCVAAVILEMYLEKKPRVDSGSMG